MAERKSRFHRYALSRTSLVVCAGFALVGFYGIVTGHAAGFWSWVAFGSAVAAIHVLRSDGGPSRSRDEALDEQAKMLGISKQDLVARIERHEREEQIAARLVKEFKLPEGDGDPLPPWIKYPGPGPYHICWRMGDGESYINGTFGPFMVALDKSQREQYFARYDLGPDWPDRQFWYHGWVEKDY